MVCHAMGTMNQALFVLLLATCSSRACAEPGHAEWRPGGDDAVLAELAPPSNRATAEVTYGDATLTRAVRSRARTMARVTNARLQCPDDLSQVEYFRCRASYFFRHNYVFTPSYFSAPQIRAPNYGGATMLQPPFTAFFFEPLN